jgi:hypothetical protein
VLRIRNRDVSYGPIKNCRIRRCSVTPRTPTPSSAAWSITPTASISPGRACGKPVNPLERPEPAALWTCRCAWTTRRALPTCPQQSNSRPTRPSSRDSRLTSRLRRCQKPDSQNASRPGRHQNRNGGRDHLGILGEIKIGTPGRDRRNPQQLPIIHVQESSSQGKDSASTMIERHCER